MGAGRAMGYALVFVVGFAVVSLWSFWLVVRPPRIRIPATPAAFGLTAETVRLRADDGVELVGWFIPQEAGAEPLGDRAAVILLHGYPAEKADMLTIAKALHPAVATLLMDLRYFGESGGSMTTLGLHERGDLGRAVDFLSDRGFDRIGVFGFSLGGAVGIMAAAADPRIQAAASYAAFADLNQLGYESYRELRLLKYPLVALLRFWARLAMGEDPTAFSPERAARGLEIPVLIIHGREDEQIAFRHAERLRVALAGNPKAEFYFFDRGLHGELPLLFDERLREFFVASLGGR